MNRVAGLWSALEARGAGGICSIFPFDRAHDEGHVLEVATLGTYFRAG